MNPRYLAKVHKRNLLFVGHETVKCSVTYEYINIEINVLYIHIYMHYIKFCIFTIFEQQLIPHTAIFTRLILISINSNVKKHAMFL